MMLLTVFSLFACAHVERPDTDLCIVNAPAQNQKCYNLKHDYTDDGMIKAGAKPAYKPAKTVDDLNKNLCTDPDGAAELKAFIRKLRQAYADK